MVLAAFLESHGAEPREVKVFLALWHVRTMDTNKWDSESVTTGGARGSIGFVHSELGVVPNCPY